MPDSKNPSARFRASSGPKPVSQKRIPRRCITSVAAAATPKMPPLAPPVSAVRCRDERAGRAAEHRDDVEGREPHGPVPGSNSRPTIQSTNMLKPMCSRPKCTIEYVKRRHHSPLRSAGPKSPRSADVRPLPLIVWSRSEINTKAATLTAMMQLRRDQRVALDRLADAHRALRRVRRGRTRSTAIRPRPGSGSRGTRAVRSGCRRGPSPDPDGGSRWPCRAQPYSSDCPVLPSGDPQVRCSPARGGRGDDARGSRARPTAPGPDGLTLGRGGRPRAARARQPVRRAHEPVVRRDRPRPTCSRASTRFSARCSC